MRGLRALVVRARRPGDGAHRRLLCRIVDALSGQCRRSRLCQSGLPFPVALHVDRAVDHRHRRGVLVGRPLGSAGYIQQFIDLPQGLIVVAVVIALGAVAAWGILESVLLASVFTLIEVGGLLAIIVAAAFTPTCRSLPSLRSRRRSTPARCPASASPACSPSLPSLDLRIWPMWWRRPRCRTATFRAPWC